MVAVALKAIKLEKRRRVAAKVVVQCFIHFDPLFRSFFNSIFLFRLTVHDTWKNTALDVIDTLGVLIN